MRRIFAAAATASLGAVLAAGPAWAPILTHRGGPLRVAAVRGEARADGARLNAGAPVAAGAEVEVAPGAAVDIAGGATAVRLAGRTRARFALDEGILRLDVRRGRALSIRTPGAGVYEVRTPVATAGVRGTTFFVEARPTSTYLCVCEGEVEAAPAARGAAAFRLSPAPGTRHRAVRIGADGRATPAGLEGHDDSTIEALARATEVSR